MPLGNNCIINLSNPMPEDTQLPQNNDNITIKDDLDHKDINVYVDNNRKGFFTRFLIILLIILLSAVSGAVGSFYSNQIRSLPYFRQLFYGGTQNTNNLSQLLPSTDQSSEPIVKIVSNVSPAVVSIIIKTDLSKTQSNNNPYTFLSPFFNTLNQNAKNEQSNIQTIGAGTGFFVSANGLIMTNKHVVTDDNAIYEVNFNNQTFTAKIVAKDSVNDLALLKIDANISTPFLSFANNLAMPGQSVIAIGNSLGQYGNTVTTGIISGIGRSITAGTNNGFESEQLDGVLQTDAAINPGNSGGPLLNLSGEVLGINTAVDSNGQLVGFAIPAAEASSALNSYLKNGKITRPLLGVRYIILNDDISKKEGLSKNAGALITHGINITDYAVLPGSPADKAGLKEGDIILKVNEDMINADNTLTTILKKYNPGDTLKVSIFRNNAEVIVDVILGEK